MSPQLDGLSPFAASAEKGECGGQLDIGVNGDLHNIVAYRSHLHKSYHGGAGRQRCSVVERRAASVGGLDGAGDILVGEGDALGVGHPVGPCAGEWRYGAAGDAKLSGIFGEGESREIIYGDSSGAGGGATEARDIVQCDIVCTAGGECHRTGNAVNDTDAVVDNPVGLLQVGIYYVLVVEEVYSLGMRWRGGQSLRGSPSQHWFEMYCRLPALKSYKRWRLSVCSSWRSRRHWVQEGRH